MADVKTVDSSEIVYDPILRKKKEDVARMRASLLACSDDPTSTVSAMKTITVLRVYHQVARVIQYLDMMDKIEAKLYRSIDSTLDRMDDANPTTWMQLLSIQERLQKNMIESHKLLQPYLNVEEFNLSELTVNSIDNTSTSSSILDRQSRDRIRAGAQNILSLLDSGEVGSDD